MLTLEYWFMFPIGITIAIIAMSTLVGGATFFSPLFMLVLSLEPKIAIATALMIQVFGFGTGLIRYISQKCIDYKMGIALLFITIPYALIGSFISTQLNPYYIRILLGFMILYIGYNLFNHNKINVRRKGKKIRSFSMQTFQRKTNKINLTGEEMQSNILKTSFGSLFLGMTSAGLGEILGFEWIKKTTTNLKTIVATTIFVIAITTLVTSASHFYTLFTTNIEGLKQASSILIFTIPGVIIGAIIGTKIIDKINQTFLQNIISIILIITGIICFLPF